MGLSQLLGIGDTAPKQPYLEMIKVMFNWDIFWGLMSQLLGIGDTSPLSSRVMFNWDIYQPLIQGFPTVSFAAPLALMKHL